MRFESSGLMQLHSDPHGCIEPTVVPMPTHPTLFQCEDAFDHALHGIHGLAALLALSTIHRPIQDGDHVLAFRGLVLMLARYSQQGHLALPLKFGKQIFVI
jgi:hypothetical protein